jgi:hypothetical protein
MAKQIKIVIGNIKADGWLNDTQTASQVWKILPFNSRANLWGDEIYFDIPLKTGLEDARETVLLGDIAYWPEGPAMCIFLGKTPISRGDEIRPASAVNIIGKISNVKTLLGKVKPGEQIAIRR